MLETHGRCSSNGAAVSEPCLAPLKPPLLPLLLTQICEGVPVPRRRETIRIEELYPSWSGTGEPGVQQQQPPPPQALRTLQGVLRSMPRRPRERERRSTAAPPRTALRLARTRWPPTPSMSAATISRDSIPPVGAAGPWMNAKAPPLTTLQCQRMMGGASYGHWRTGFRRAKAQRGQTFR